MKTNTYPNCFTFNVVKAFSAVKWLIDNSEKELHEDEIHKIIYQADVEHFREYGRSITFSNYKRYGHGPRVVPIELHKFMIRGGNRNVIELVGDSIYLSISDIELLAKYLKADNIDIVYHDSYLEWMGEDYDRNGDEIEEAIHMSLYMT